jgi:uncharacterized protein (DUF1015 family)
MPELQPFRGIRYPHRDLAARVCPPYDVISPSEQRSLHERHPHNAVRLELPEDGDGETRYRRAADTFARWMEEGILAADAHECVYVYRQDFRDPRGTRRRVAGVIGALKLEELGDRSGILPHERTMPGPKKDRLELLRACPVNMSPLYLIYRGGGDIAPLVDSLEARAPDFRFTDETGILHRLWAVHAGAEVSTLVAAVSTSALVIADGHHRYETALAYHREQGSETGTHDAVMAFCVDADVEELVVLPYHRTLESSVESAELARRLAGEFGASVVPAEESARAFHTSEADHPFLFLLAEGTALVEVDDAFVVSAVGDRARAWRDLDVVALHEGILPRLLPEGVEGFTFSRDEKEIADLVVSGKAPAGVLLRPLSPVQVIDAARAGERLPQKASYFWPKAVTGLVFRSLQ